MPKKHLWIIVSFQLPLAVFIWENCQGIKVREGSTKWTHSQGKFHYFYQSTTSHC